MLQWNVRLDHTVADIDWKSFIQCKLQHSVVLLTTQTQALIHPHASASFQYGCLCSIHLYPAMHNERVSTCVFAKNNIS